MTVWGDVLVEWCGVLDFVYFCADFVGEFVLYLVQLVLFGHSCDGEHPGADGGCGG